MNRFRFSNADYGRAQENGRRGSCPASTETTFFSVSGGSGATPTAKGSAIIRSARFRWGGLVLMGLVGVSRAVGGGMGAGALVAETPLTQEQLVAARLPAESFAVADDTFSNVWVEEREAGRVPAVIEPVTDEPVLVEYPVFQRVAPDEEGWQVIDLATRGVPLSRLTFFTDGTLFSRRYTLHGLTPGKDGAVIETPVVDGTLTQVDSQDVTATHLTVSFAPRRYEVYRLRLAVEAKPTVGAVRAEGPAWQVVVSMRPGRQYRFRVGGESPDSLDTVEHTAVAALRARGAEPTSGRIEHFELITDTRPPVFGRSQMLLLSMLIAGGVLLGWLLRVAKRMN